MSTQILASERQHWYSRDGAPAYEVPCTSKDGMRPTNIEDARAMGLVPSVTLILNQVAKPGLEAWKARQLLDAALTLPQRIGETLDDYARRVIEDSRAQSIAARDRGTDLHASIEDYIRGIIRGAKYFKHCEKIETTLELYGVPLRQGKPEHSFASELGYGGKTDFAHDAGVIVDFKTKDRIDSKVRPYDEHVMQLSAYGHGLFIPPFRALSVFVGIEDCEVRIFEFTWPDLAEAFEQFKLLLTYFQRKNKLGPFRHVIDDNELMLPL